MTKLCEFEGCDEEILLWQTYCYKHGGKKKMENPVPPNYGVPQQPVAPESPKQQPMVYDAQPKPIRETTPLESHPKERSEGVPVRLPKFEIPKLESKDRLIVKQVAFKGAIEVLTSMELSGDYKTLVGELRRLTVDFYNVIVEKNEG